MCAWKQGGREEIRPAAIMGHQQRGSGMVVSQGGHGEMKRGWASRGQGESESEEEEYYGLALVLLLVGGWVGRWMAEDDDMGVTAGPEGRRAGRAQGVKGKGTLDGEEEKG